MSSLNSLDLLFLQNIIGQEVGKSVIDEYLRLPGHSNLCSKPLDVPTSNLHAYVKPPSHECYFSGSKKPVKAPKSISISSKEIEPKKVASSSNVENQVSSDTRNTLSGKGNQSSSKKKKAGKAVSLAEAAKGSFVFQQGKPCSCQARRHRLVSNCLSCGKIICEQEGEGPCNFCGSLVLRERSTYAGMDEGFTPLSDAEAAAEAYAKRLVEYDRNSAARTSVIDDQSDYYQIEGNSWLSNEVCRSRTVSLNGTFSNFVLKITDFLLLFRFQEKELLRKKQEEIEEAERAKRNKVVVTFDLVGRKVISHFYLTIDWMLSSKYVLVLTNNMDRPPSLALKYI